MKTTKKDAALIALARAQLDYLRLRGGLSAPKKVAQRKKFLKILAVAERLHASDDEIQMVLHIATNIYCDQKVQKAAERKARSSFPPLVWSDRADRILNLGRKPKR